MTQSRRNFLRYSTLAGLGLSLHPLSAFSLPDEPHEDPHKPLLQKGQQLLTLLQTTDVHCQLHPHDELFWEKDKMVFRTRGGYAHLASYFRSVRQQNPNTFIIDTGDMFQGSQLSVETTGLAIQPILEALGYDLFLPGNWEVIYYKEMMEKLLGGLRAPKVCANMYHDPGDGKRGELIFPPYRTWSAAGIKIGFVGYTDPLVPIRQSPAYSKGIIYAHPEENLQQYVRQLRQQEHCQFIILLSHLGLSQQIALANSPECAGVDYIFGGDTHERVRRPIQCRYAKVVEPGAFGSFAGRLDLVVENGRVVSDHYSLVDVDPEKFRADPAVAALIESEEHPFRKKMDAVLGYSQIPLYRYFVVENTIDTLVIDALMWRVKTDVVLSNGFRFCPPRRKKDGNGLIPITESYLYDMLPVNSIVRRGKVTGAQIEAWLEKELTNVFSQDPSGRIGGWFVKFKGMKATFRAYAPNGKRIESITIAGEPLDPARIYSIAACEREGDPPNTLCRMINVSEPENLPWHLHDIITDYLREHSPVKPVPESNAVVLDAPSHLLTQVAGVDYSFH